MLKITMMLILFAMAIILVNSGLKARRKEIFSTSEPELAREARNAKFHGGELLLVNYPLRNIAVAYLSFTGRMAALTAELPSWNSEQEYLQIVAELCEAGRRISLGAKVAAFPQLKPLGSEPPTPTTLSYEGKITGIGKGISVEVPRTRYAVRLNNAITVTGIGLEEAVAKSGVSLGDVVKIVRHGNLFYIDGV